MNTYSINDRVINLDYINKGSIFEGTVISLDKSNSLYQIKWDYGNITNNTYNSIMKGPKIRNIIDEFIQNNTDVYDQKINVINGKLGRTYITSTISNWCWRFSISSALNNLVRSDNNIFESVFNLFEDFPNDSQDYAELIYYIQDKYPNSIGKFKIYNWNSITCSLWSKNSIIAYLLNKKYSNSNKPWAIIINSKFKNKHKDLLINWKKKNKKDVFRIDYFQHLDIQTCFSNKEFGGHVMILIGIGFDNDNSKNRITVSELYKYRNYYRPYFIIKNSYGSDRGHNGIIRIDCELLWNVTSLCSAIEPINHYLSVNNTLIDKLNKLSYNDYSSRPFEKLYRKCKYILSSINPFIKPLYK